MNNNDKEQIFEIANEYLGWAKGIPEPMELYETKIEEFSKMIRKYGSINFIRLKICNLQSI